MHAFILFTDVEENCSYVGEAAPLKSAKQRCGSLRYGYPSAALAVGRRHLFPRHLRAAVLHLRRDRSGLRRHPLRRFLHRAK